jgi:hypothetical protein
MSYRVTLPMVALSIALTSSACALRAANIEDLQQRPGRYEDRSVTLTGVVTDSWGVPLLPYKFYRVDDGTGQIAVLSQSSRMPGKGERVRVKGRVSNIAILGGRSLGLHLREEDLDIRR